MSRNWRTEKVTDKSVTLKWGDEDLGDSIKISLSQELNRLIELFKVKFQQKDSEIELLLEKEIVHRAQIEALQSLLEQASQNNAHLSRDIENSNLEKGDLSKELLETRADLEGAENELELVKNKSEQEMEHLRQELKEEKHKLVVAEIGHTLLKSESDEEKASLKKELKEARTDLEGARAELNLLKSESGKEKTNLEKELKETKAILKEQVNMIERLKKDVLVKSEKVESQLKLIAEQQSKIKRFSENEEWFNLISAEQNQESKTLIQAKEAKLLESQKQLELLKTEKNSLSEKISSFEEEVTTLQTRLGESELLHLKTLEKKDGEVILLNKEIEFMNIKIQLMEMNNETNHKHENTKIANLEVELENKLEEHDNKVEISEDELKMLEEQFASLSPVREDVKVDDDDVTLIDMDLGSKKEEEVKEDDNYDDSQSSTSKPRSEAYQPRSCKDEKDKRQSSTRTKRSRSCSPMGESRKHKRPDPTVEGKKRQASLERSPSLVIEIPFDRLGEGVQERVEAKKLCWVRPLKSQWKGKLEGEQVEEQEKKSSKNKKEMVKNKGWNFGKKK